ncbi:bacteriocin fulvocin C-related protein [Spongiactinospora rosea]|uniref:bacteriocin fulvocin C-related protein n=1 Tax=Spongiactinospora rosea TaxID=2248750 RepID=UPI0011C0415C|nr:bacteriocin fulvocin C-related protein [Spongiactinospora rosea]
MRSPDTHWVMAFDASCRQCRTVADQIAHSSDHRVHVLPLDHPDVAGWRARARGGAAPDAPTLIRVGPDAVHAWTGPAMALRLALRLGPRATLRFLKALGALRKGVSPPAGGPESAAMGRGQFFRLAGLGAAALFVFGKVSPAHAETGRAAEWVRANNGRLPREYSQFIGHDLAVRRAVYRELTPAERSRLWVSHLREYRAAHPALTAAKNTVLEDAINVAAQEPVFAAGADPALDARLAGLRRAAIEAFGREEARALLATLGPAGPVSPPGSATCGCSTQDDWCATGSSCRGCANCSYCACTCTASGCGTLWRYRCNGNCG